MKFSTRTIALVVICIMAGVFFYQLYWLKGLYNSTRQQLEKNVMEAMGTADQNELFTRIEIVKEGNQNINVDADVEEDSTGTQAYYTSHKKQDSIYFTNSSNDKEEFEYFKESARTTEKLAAYLQTNLHRAIDTIFPIDFCKYDSLLGVELEKYNIYRPFRIVMFNAENDSILASIAGQDSIIIQHAHEYNYLFDMYGKRMYRLYLNNPNQQVIHQMVGILSTSVIIFFILLFLFRYLIKIIKRLQTEEELKTNFTNNMTHELKTPIAVSYAAVDALLVSDQPVSKERQTKYLTIAKEQMQQLTGLVEQILSMSRSDNRRIDLNPEKINLAQMMEGLIEKAKLMTDKKIDFKLNLNETMVKADKMHLGNILNNLIENGIKYSDDAVVISVSAEKHDHQCVIKVSDNGPGIDIKYQSRIFDKFYRIPTGNRHNVKGYGLGLFYVKEMIERHGGTIAVTSHPGKGTCFTLKIPQ